MVEALPTPLLNQTNSVVSASLGQHSFYLIMTFSWSGWVSYNSRWPVLTCFEAYFVRIYKQFYLLYSPLSPHPGYKLLLFRRPVTFFFKYPWVGWIALFNQISWCLSSKECSRICWRKWEYMHKSSLTEGKISTWSWQLKQELFQTVWNIRWQLETGVTRRKLIRPEQEYLRYGKGFVRFTVLMVKNCSYGRV